METYKDFAPTVVDRHITIEGHDGGSREDWPLPNVDKTYVYRFKVNSPLGRALMNIIVRIAA